MQDLRYSVSCITHLAAKTDKWEISCSKYIQLAFPLWFVSQWTWTGISKYKDYSKITDTLLQKSICIESPQ